MDQIVAAGSRHLELQRTPARDVDTRGGRISKHMGHLRRTYASVIVGWAAAVPCFQ